MRVLKIEFTFSAALTMDTLIYAPLWVMTIRLTSGPWRLLGLVLTFGITGLVHCLANTRGRELQKGIKDHDDDD
jgi:hypothetical protein